MIGSTVYGKKRKRRKKETYSFFCNFFYRFLYPLSSTILLGGIHRKKSIYLYLYININMHSIRMFIVARSLLYVLVENLA